MKKMLESNTGFGTARRRPEQFLKEVEAWIPNSVEDKDRLASEIANDPLVIDGKTKEARSAILKRTLRVRCSLQDNRACQFFKLGV